MILNKIKQIEELHRLTDDFTWKTVYKDIINALLYIYISTDKKLISDISYDKQRFFYYNVYMDVYKIGVDMVSPTPEQKKLIISTLESFNCATHID
jgi:hypothetical protein